MCICISICNYTRVYMYSYMCIYILHTHIYIHMSVCLYTHEFACAPKKIARALRRAANFAPRSFNVWNVCIQNRGSGIERQGQGTAIPWGSQQPQVRSSYIL